MDSSFESGEWMNWSDEENWPDAFPGRTFNLATSSSATAGSPSFVDSLKSSLQGIPYTQPDRATMQMPDPWWTQRQFLPDTSRIVKVNTLSTGDQTELDFFLDYQR